MDEAVSLDELRLGDRGAPGVDGRASSPLPTASAARSSAISTTASSSTSSRSRSTSSSHASSWTPIPTAAKTPARGDRAGVREALENVRELAQRDLPPASARPGPRRGAPRYCGRKRRPDARSRPVNSTGTRPSSRRRSYFCCLEALENVARHAGEGARATVRVWSERDALLFDVTDDGAGFDPAGERGSGLNSMSDRLGAFGGRLTVVSEPERGTRVSGRNPASAMTVRVLVADDQAPFRRAARSVLDALAELSARRRGGQRRRGGCARRRAAPRPRADGHHDGRHRRHRGGALDQRQASGDGDDPRSRPTGARICPPMRGRAAPRRTSTSPISAARCCASCGARALPASAR